MSSENLTETKLYIVATPIGNLSDLSGRAVEVLANVDLIACEDTRTSSRLLKHYGIQTPMLSFHQHNEHTQVEKLMQMLQSGQRIALISDAGMPGISDPGFLAVRAAHRLQIPVSVIPGPSAVLTALVASGLPADRFVFEGYLPHKKGRQTRLQQLSGEHRTVILFESPHRILKLLEEIITHFGQDRFIAVTREMTKKFEEVIRGTAAEVNEIMVRRGKIKGEITVIIAGPDYRE